MTATEGVESFACFGSHCTVLVVGDGAGISAAAAAADARDRLLAWHDQFSRWRARLTTAVHRRVTRAKPPLLP